jgi:hypothetical protein
MYRYLMGCCKGVCTRKEYTAPAGKRTYNGGGKRCTECALFIKWDGIHCPCCGTKLRIRIRSRPIPIKFVRY